MTLVQHWQFEEGAGSTAASSVGGAPLTLVNPDTFATGHDGDYAISGQAHATAQTPAAPVTLMGWVQPTSLPAVAPLFGWWADASTGTTGLALYAQRSDFGPAGVLQGDVRVNGSLVPVGGGSPLVVGEWTHVAITYDGSTARLFRDGAQVGQASASGTMNTYGAFNVYAGANIDEIRVYNTALTASEIVDAAGLGAPANQPPTVSAGVDRQVFVGTEVTLSGSASDTDGTIASSGWTQTAGPAVTLGGSGSTRTFTPASLGTYTFAFTATDDGGAAAADSVTITALAIPEPSNGNPASFGMIEKAVKSLIETNFPDHEVGGDLSYDGGDPYVFIAKVPGGTTDQTGGEWIVDVDVFAGSYGAAMRLALDIEALLVRGRHVTPVMRIDSTFQNETPSERPWDDETVFRVGATYTFTARRSG